MAESKSTGSATRNCTLDYNALQFTNQIYPPMAGFTLRKITLLY